MSEPDRSDGRTAASPREGVGVRPSPLPTPPRLLRSSRGAAWLVGAALLAHLTAGWVELPVEPAAASTSSVSLVDDRGGAALAATPAEPVVRRVGLPPVPPAARPGAGVRVRTPLSAGGPLR